MGNSGLWIPKHTAVKRTNVVFYYNTTLDHIVVGFPEEFPCPLHGYQKIVCQNAAEVDRWSQKIREQDRRYEEMTDEQREAFEGPIRDSARKQLIHQMMNAQDAVNRDFCRRALDLMDESDKKRRMKRESFMHIEGFESNQ